MAAALCVRYSVSSAGLNPPPSSGAEAEMIVNGWTEMSAGRHLLLRTRRDYEQLVVRYESEARWRHLKWNPRDGRYTCAGPRWASHPLRRPGFAVKGAEPPWPFGLTCGGDMGRLMRNAPSGYMSTVEKMYKHYWWVHRAHWSNPEGYPKGWDRCVLMREDAISLCDALQARSRERM